MNPKLKIISIICIVFFAVLFFIDEVKACSCGIGKPLNVVFEKTNNILVLRLESIDTVNDKLGTYSHQNVNFVVQKIFKGDSKVGDIVTFRQNERTTSSCNWTIDKKLIGEDYLFYLNTIKPKKTPLRLWMCSRTKLVKNARLDLLYLEKEKKVRSKTRLSGSITQTISSIKGWQFYQYKNLADRKLRIVGNGIDIELKTDKFGVFEKYDLLPGKYKVYVEKLFGYKYTFRSPTIFLQSKKTNYEIVEIKPKGHTETSFNYRIHNSISGIFFDSNGQPLRNVNLELVPTIGKAHRNFYQGDEITDKNGKFKFKNIPEGAYYISINPRGKISASQPFETFYYPNVKTKDKASIFTIGPGYFLDNLNITAPETAETITISGTVFFEDGKAVTKENAEYVYVSLVYKKEGKEITVSSNNKLDEKGNFKIRVLKGQTGHLRGSISTFTGKYENCKKHDELLRNKSKLSRDSEKQKTVFGNINTNQLDVDTYQNQEGIILTFPYPSCKKRKLDRNK